MTASYKLVDITGDKKVVPKFWWFATPSVTNLLIHS